jgi:hypothetical protein
MSYEIDKKLELAANAIRREFSNVSAPRTAIACLNSSKAAAFSGQGPGSVGQTYGYRQLKT